MVHRNNICRILYAVAFSFSGIAGFQSAPTSPYVRNTLLSMVSTAPKGKQTKKPYVPKWTKKETLADSGGKLSYTEIGLKGTIPVLFKQGNVTKSTMALAGQPIRDAASQAGQFIKYGCGKGECGTCEAMCNGKWIRPCIAHVPSSLPPGEEYVVQVKEIKSKSVSSGTFFSVRSFFLGFWNNLLGIVGFFKYRRNAKKNWEERSEYEDLIKKKVMEKKLQRQQAELENLNKNIEIDQTLQRQDEMDEAGP